MEKTVGFEALSPATFLDRSASVYPDKPAIIYGNTSYTYAEFAERVRRLSSALAQVGVGYGDKVGFLVPNVPAMLEGHYGPMRLGAVLVAINIRLSAREIAYILNHSGAKVLVFDSEYAPVIKDLRDEVPGISRMFGDRCSSQASAVCIGVAPSRAATSLSVDDCSGLKPPSGKYGTYAMPSRASASIRPSSFR